MMKSSILICFGTRPEWIKIKPILKSIQNFNLFYTGQHDSLIGDVLSEYKIKFQINIGESSDRLNNVIAKILSSFPETKHYTHVLVQGDTASAFACALAGYNRGKKVIHLEAGLRTYDLENPFPEEAYRQMISRISSINLCATDLSKSNLINEKINGQIEVVGNTVLDNLVNFEKDLKPSNKVLITLHRRENHPILEHWIEAINQIVIENSDLDFYFISHPNPNIATKIKFLVGVKIIEPMQHKKLIKFINSSLFIISDSGGLQEEGSFLNKKVIVCRKITERPEGIDSGHLYLCESPSKLNTLVKYVKQNPTVENKCPYGDGNSAEKISQILNK